MRLNKLLVANRGEIAIRVMRTAAERGIETVAVYAEDDSQSLHTRKADAALSLDGTGVPAYLDGKRIVALAKQTGCDAIHPGYGFLSENAGFAKLCADEGIVFVGPNPDVLDLFGDKVRARALAEKTGLPVLSATRGTASAAQALDFLQSLGNGGAMVIKAVAGGGGRGMRIVTSPEDVEQAHAICRSEAEQAFGNGDVYAERLIPRARHIEVQVVGDKAGAVTHLWERDCSIQRRHQKLLEIAPSPALSPDLRDNIVDAAVRLAEAAGYDNVGTFEFLVDTEKEGDDAFVFIEANPRLQVEHTVTEEITGTDIVALQLRIAAGETLGDLGLDTPLEPRGFAIQARINMETMAADGTARPAGGTLSAFDLPSGLGIRTDTFGYSGYRTSPHYDSLLAKLIGHTPSPDFADAVARTYRALCETRVAGVRTNLSFLQNLLSHPDVAAGRTYTRFVDDHVADLVATDDHRRLFFEPTTAQPRTGAGAKVDAADPLAVLDHGRNGGDAAAVAQIPEPLADSDIVGPDGTVPLAAPMQGTIVSIAVAEGDSVHQGRPVLVMEAMKMQHEIPATTGGILRRFAVAEGDTVFEGHPLAFIEPAEVEAAETEVETEIDLDEIRPDLAEVHARHAIGLDEARPDSVAKRHARGQRTARENVADLCDPGTFIEYSPLMIAAQRQRHSVDYLIEKTPADGLVAGIGQVNGDLFGETRSRCAVFSYDYMVLAGTQGFKNHDKKDRLFDVAEKWRLPIVFFTEGGGGRPGDTDIAKVGGLDVMAFHLFGRLSGLVPMVGINSGRCFAGNAAILGCCDVVIATANSNIGMGGPAMIEGGGLGVFRPEEVGPMEVQASNGVVDIAVADEAEAVQAAKQYLSYFQGPVDDWDCADQRWLRRSIPEDRLRVYDIRTVIDTMADTGSVLELRRGFGPGMVTALARIEGRPVGIVANNPMHLAGAIDSNGADKAARFMQLCDAFDVPLLFLCDTPGMMVGPEVEKTALVRHCCRLFVTGANLTVPFFTVVLRKSYGLGAQAMAGGSFRAPFFTVSWPTGEFGGMGLEGAVKLGYRNELAAIEDPVERTALFDKMVAQAYEHGKALNTASLFEIDDVIDPVDTRKWIVGALKSIPPKAPREGKKRPNIDTW